ncbi:hypothetical protein ABTC40_18980, partial [Acinetobacter baumannii]
KELREQKKATRDRSRKNRLSRELKKAQGALSLLSSLQGSSGSQREVTDGRNSPGVNPWRVLRVGLFLPLLGKAVPRDLSPLKVFLHRGAWEG